MSCPICSSENYIHIYSTTRPLSVTTLPSTAKESCQLRKYTMDIVQCSLCTHVYNTCQNLREEIYHGEGCTMYNSGVGWQKHIKEQQKFIEDFVASFNVDKIIEVGAGDGSFLAGINHPNKVAYEPSQDYFKCIKKGLKAVRGYFTPDVAPRSGSLIILRHVLEHFHDPREFIESIVNKVQDVTFFIEVPCVENALIQNRVEDWVYEHPQHFTAASLGRLMLSLHFKANRFRKTYGDEVIIYSGRVEKNTSLYKHVTSARGQLNEIRKQEQLVFWGGAGKSAMFLNEFSENTDLVVDSDYRKIGKFVPGLQLEIRDPSILVGNPTIVITTYWRANDIIEDIKSRGITPKSVLVYKNGSFVKVQ